MSFNPTSKYESGQLYESGGPYDGFRYPGENGSDWKIELAVDLAANGVGDWFTFDDPVKGVLDNPDYLLAGEVLIDITRWVRTLTITRGKSRRLAKFTAGTCSFSLDNRDRLFDPLMTGSPLYGSIVPRKEVRVTYKGSRIFTGNVEDWDFTYDLSGDSLATPTSADALSFLARHTYEAATEVSEPATDRFNKVLDAVGWPTDARIIVGDVADSVTLVADTHQDVSSLQYLQQIELSDSGSLFVTKTGQVEFRIGSRGTWAPEFKARFGVGGIPISAIQVIYETDVMTNAVTCEYNGTSVTMMDADSQAAYGMLASSYQTLIASLTQAQEFAQGYVDSFKNPPYYISELTVNMRGASTEDVATLMSLELADAVQVVYRPNNIGDTQTYSLVIDGISHSATPASYAITFRMSPPIITPLIPA